jgi:catechol 2,3-dioxygenase-like lactoylglutathione lyase family enzyme
MLFQAIDHPAISCNEPRILAKWYCDHLGMKILHDNGQDPASLLLGYDTNLRASATLELMPVKNPGTPAADLPRFCQGLRHFAVRVSDFDTAYGQLKQAGVEFLFEPATAIGGGKIVSFRDPEGNEVQIVQR